MTTIQNSLIIKNVIEALFKVAGRRTLNSYALQVVKTVVNKLADTYEFFHGVTIEDAAYTEGGLRILVDATVEMHESTEIGRGIDSLIRVMYMDMLETSGENTGLFFVTELKEHLREDVVEALVGYGIDFEHIQSEQHHLYRGIEKKPFTRRPEQDEEKKPTKLDYSWDNVSTWKYDNNVCFLYDNKGALLDTLQLDLIIEDYIQRLTDFQQSSSEASSVMRISSKENDFLTLLRDQDINVESALQLLEVSRQKLEVMLHKLVNLEMLEYLSEKEVKITEKGLQYLAEKQPVETPR